MEIRDEKVILEEALKYQDIIIYGKRSLVNIMCRFLQNNNIIVNNVSYMENQSKQGEFLGVPFKSIAKMRSRAESCLVIAVVDHTEQKVTKVKSVLEEKQYKNIIYPTYELLSEIGTKEHAHLDFVCTGFVKCGTTSLHAALKKNKNVFLPKKKETLYMWWREKLEDAPERFNKIYFTGIKDGQVVGNVEPSYHEKYDGIYECHGKDTKIIFMVRNPVDAAYSYFKMLMRKTTSKEQVKYYKKYFKFNVKMFDDYIKDYLVSGKEERFNYIKFIKKYEEYFGKENIKVVFFEELLRNTEEVMNDVQEFVGVKPMKFTSLPHSNEGKEVSKNYLCAVINRKLYRKDIALRSVYSKEEKERHEKFKAFCHKHTLVTNTEKMDSESRTYLTEFYKKSVEELEEFCGRSLEGLWY